MKNVNSILAGSTLGAAIALGCVAQAMAQPMPPQAPPAVEQQAAPDQDGADMQVNCGSWQSGTWVPTGACGPNDYRSHVAGTITSVKGHLVTLQQTTQTLVINDQPALDRKTTGRVAVGRQVSAAGYWRNGTFYATLIR
jgi:hypothetical protein